MYRLSRLLRFAGAVVATVLFGYLVVTLSSFYPGTGSMRPDGPDERTVAVDVHRCWRDGPVSAQGLGWWRTCGVIVPAVAGRPAFEAFVDRSVVREDQIGTTVELREACYDPPLADCRYGTATGLGWQFYRGAMRLLGWFGVSVLSAVAIYILLTAIIGEARAGQLRREARRRLGTQMMQELAAARRRAAR